MSIPIIGNPLGYTQDPVEYTLKGMADVQPVSRWVGEHVQYVIFWFC